jgi:nitroreductase
MSNSSTVTRPGGPVPDALAGGSSVAEPQGDEPWPPSWDAAATLIGARQNISAKRLVEPGPDAAQRQALLALAAAAPDHGELTPWRFVIVPAAHRHRLADVFAQALLERDADATAEQLAAAREKAHRAPLLMLAVARMASAREPEIPNAERLVSLGCALQNLLLGAVAMGFGGGLTSGQAMGSAPMRALFSLAADESAVCFVNIGTVSKRKAGRVRPAVESFVSTLQALP